MQYCFQRKLLIPLFRYSIFCLFLSPICDGYRVPFNIEHALDCRFGSLVTHRHDEVLNAVGDLASLIWTPVVKEPVVHDGSAGADTLIADLCVCGLWEPQTEALFDIRVVDTDAQSYRTHSSRDVLGSAEVKNRHKYL